MNSTKEISQRSEAATPGPWIVGDGTKATMWNGKNTVLTENGKYVVMDRAIYPNDEEFNSQVYANMFFVAHARTDIPYLLDQNSKLESELESSKRQIADLRKLANTLLASTIENGCPDCESPPRCPLTEKPRTRNFDPVICADCWVDYCLSQIVDK